MNTPPFTPCSELEALLLAYAEGSLPLAEATTAQYKRMVQLGLGELDKSGIAELTFKGRQSTAVTVRATAP